jgi:hypothetical protein
METRMQKDKLRNIILKEQATQAGISIAEAASQDGINDEHLGAMPPLSRARSSSFHSLPEMSSPEYYRIHTPYQTREIHLDKHHYKHHLGHVNN